MHQIFYIDVNEEVNSIIGKIRKSNSKYNILVIAQGALLMQSAVSLKLIKREIDSLDKKIMFITRDERAATIATKIGFPVKKSLEEVKGLDSQIIQKQTDIQYPKNMGSRELNSSDLNNIVIKKNRLVNLGSDSFISASGITENKKNQREAKKDKSWKDEVSTNKPQKELIGNKKLSEPRDDAFNNLFIPSSEPPVIEKKKDFSTKKVVKFIWIFAVIILILVAGIAAYFLLPKAEVVVFPFKKNENISLELNVTEGLEDSNNYQNNIINLKTEVTEKENTLSLNFESTGQKGDSNQKARGKITIYNEFSEASQVLVVTTRFLSNNNKLFRLLETVTVPGMSMKDGKMEPGKADADIVADEAGIDFNIKEADFKIPGLKGSSKYDKFYAKLIQETKGGGNSENNLKIVSKSDIESAKFKTEEQLKNQLKENIKDIVGRDKFLLDNAVAYEVVDFSVFPEEGSITESFEYQVKMKAKALSFSNEEMNNNIKDFIKNSFIQNSFIQKNSPMSLVSFENNYGNADIDFSKKAIKMDVNVNLKLRSEIDVNDLSRSLAGKSKDELSDVIKKYPEINRAEALISPSFLANSFPRYPSKIKVQVNND